MSKSEETVVIKIIKPIKVTEVGPNKLVKDQEIEVSKSVGDVLVSKKFGEEVKSKKSKGSEDTISAEDAIKAIGEAKKLEDLEPFEKDERKTVKKAYDEKKLQLTQV